MNSLEIYNMLEKMDDKHIQILINVSIKYLEKNRNIKYKEIMKDIKNLHKIMN